MTQFISSPYHLNYTDEKGNTRRIELTGEETFSTTCQVCGEEHQLEFFEFCDIMAKYEDLYGTAVNCDKCSRHE